MKLQHSDFIRIPLLESYRTLYHGTSKKRAELIRKSGKLEPQIGEWSSNFYDDNDGVSAHSRGNLSPVTLAADKQHIDACVQAMLYYIAKDYPESSVLSPDDAIKRFGALFILKGAGEIYQQFDGDEDNQFSRQLEPNDYFSTNPVEVAHAPMLTGNKLLEFLIKYNAIDLMNYRLSQYRQWCNPAYPDDYNDVLNGELKDKLRGKAVSAAMSKAKTGSPDEGIYKYECEDCGEITYSGPGYETSCDSCGGVASNIGRELEPGRYAAENEVDEFVWQRNGGPSSGGLLPRAKIPRDPIENDYNMYLKQHGKRATWDLD